MKNPHNSKEREKQSGAAQESAGSKRKETFREFKARVTRKGLTGWRLCQARDRWDSANLQYTCKTWVALSRLVGCYEPDGRLIRSVDQAADYVYFCWMPSTDVDGKIRFAELEEMLDNHNTAEMLNILNKVLL